MLHFKNYVKLCLGFTIRIKYMHDNIEHEKILTGKQRCHPKEHNN